MIFEFTAPDPRKNLSYLLQITSTCSLSPKEIRSITSHRLEAKNGSTSIHVSTENPQITFEDLRTVFASLHGIVRGHLPSVDPDEMNSPKYLKAIIGRFTPHWRHNSEKLQEFHDLGLYVNLVLPGSGICLSTTNTFCCEVYSNKYCVAEFLQRVFMGCYHVLCQNEEVDRSNDWIDSLKDLSKSWIEL